METKSFPRIETMQADPHQPVTIDFHEIWSGGELV